MAYSARVGGHAGPLPRAGQRGHAPADAGGDGGPLLQAVFAAFSDDSLAGRRPGAGGAAAVAGSGVLLAGAEPSGHGEGRPQRAWRETSDRRRGTSEAPGDWTVYRGSDRVDRFR